MTALARLALLAGLAAAAAAQDPAEPTGPDAAQGAAPAVDAGLPEEPAPAPQAAAAGDPAAPVPVEEGAEGDAAASRPLDALRAPADLAQRLARDARLAFPGSAAEHARRDLAAGLPAARERAIALVALGAAGSVADRARIEASAAEAPWEERLAAILALGELGGRGERALLRLDLGSVAPAVEPPPEPLVEPPADPLIDPAPAPEPEEEDPRALAEAAALALARARGTAGPAELAAHPDQELVTRLLDLRWEAARRYGLVDGLRWQAWRTEELLGQPLFLLRAVLGAARELDPLRASDHFLQVLVEREEPERLAPIVAFMPEEVSDLVATGRWAPAGPAEWDALIGAIEAERLEHRTIDLLLLASGAPDLQERVVPLLLRAGEPAPDGWVAQRLREQDPARLVTLVEALGEGRHEEHLSDLWSLVTRSDDADVAAAALVALARLGDPASGQALEDRLGTSDEEARVPVVRALARVAHDPRMRAIAGRVPVRGLPAPVALELDLALARGGAPRDLAAVRQWLGSAFPREVRRTAIRVLAARPSEADLRLFHQVFPLDGEPDLNVELAVALIRHRDPLARTILRRVLWEGTWTLSLLAGGLLLGGGGPYSLQDELEAPPVGASAPDRRRVGFALGLWGGMQVVEVLARKRSESDPILQGAYLGVLSTRDR